MELRASINAYKITKDTKIDCDTFIHSNREKQAIKEKKNNNLPWQLKPKKIEVKSLKTNDWYTEARRPKRRRQKIHSHEPTSTQSSYVTLVGAETFKWTSQTQQNKNNNGWYYVTVVDQLLQSPTVEWNRFLAPALMLNPPLLRPATHASFLLNKVIDTWFP